MPLCFVFTTVFGVWDRTNYLERGYFYCMNTLMVNVIIVKFPVCDEWTVLY